MKIAVRYYSKSGNSKTLAEAVGKAVNAEVENVEVPLDQCIRDVRMQRIVSRQKRLLRK